MEQCTVKWVARVETLGGEPVVVTLQCTLGDGHGGPHGAWVAWDA